MLSVFLIDDSNVFHKRLQSQGYGYWSIRLLMCFKQCNDKARYRRCSSVDGVQEPGTRANTQSTWLVISAITATGHLKAILLACYVHVSIMISMRDKVWVSYNTQALCTIFHFRPYDWQKNRNVKTILSKISYWNRCLAHVVVQRQSEF